MIKHLVIALLLLFTISMHAQVANIPNKENMLRTLKNFPDDGPIISLIRSDFENISENRIEVIRMFDRLLDSKKLDDNSKQRILQKAQVIVIDGNDDMVSAYISNNSNLKSEKN